MSEDESDGDLPGYGGGTSYWDNRYLESTAPFDWLETYSDLRPHIDCVSCGNRDISILDAGCGNSLLAEQLYDDGYRNITSIDNSQVVVQQMIARQQQTARPELQWLCMDVLEMSFPDSSFDLVIDKSLLDTLMCTSGPAGDTSAYLQGVFRILRSRGTLMCVSYGKPETREYLFELQRRDSEFAFKLYTCELPAHHDAAGPHYLYLVVKVPLF
ncbi:unnamed protein product [Prorocentrum cordatum]|uniref:Methyltransferase type 11 domain-containing protein n=1 Tax=Prorocentrum cordatum TaxID=2364126 RepID=A0ABN9REH5_9DINO|nr:unnamed protein product [Polarella glacialis]